MRVTIEHREESAGLTGATKHHFVDCTVEFSEEEKAIVKARDLYNHNFSIAPATPTVSDTAYISSAVLNTLGRFMVLGGILLFFLSPFIGEMPYAPLGFFGAIAGGVIWAWAALKMWRQDKRILAPDQVIKIKDLISRGRFTVYASSPVGAEGVEGEMRTALANIKQLISASAEIKARQTFEL